MSFLGIQGILNPSIFHGREKRAPFFEGWYYKLITADEGTKLAVIPGIIKGEKEHAFIQVMDGVSGTSSYHTYPVKDFWAARDRFEVQAGNSWFNAESLRLQIRSDERQIQGRLRFRGLQPWPITWLSPGVMGPYAWVPRMECYHGVISLDHDIDGSLEVDGRAIDFTGGRGYMEKDWGQSFPSAWVWFQTNHFTQPGACITASVAIIPWLGSAFRGFIIGLWLNGELYRFASYTGAHIHQLKIGEDQVGWEVGDRHYRLQMTARRATGGKLLGPDRQEMGKRVDETMNATVEVRLIDRMGEEIFYDTGRHAGLEVNGDLKRLLGMK